jgi:CRISPR/Cas system-associated endonuclease Cas1
MIITEIQHPDWIWTWRITKNKKSVVIWIPYFDEISKYKKTWKISYQNQELEIQPSKIDSIMFYGGDGSLPLAFLEDCARYGVIVLIHRRNTRNPFLLSSARRGDSQGLMTAQILAREDQRKRVAIARNLIITRHRNIITEIEKKELMSIRNIKALRMAEARITKRFWSKYFSDLSDERISRRSDHPFSQALDAVSFFLAGIVTRWSLLHGLNIHYGFLHERTSYPALVYDLMEPIRYMGETVVAECALKYSLEQLTAESLKRIKSYLQATVYVPALHQEVKRKSLIHGTVLAFQSYLNGKSLRLTFPLEGEKKAGRRAKVGFTLR